MAEKQSDILMKLVTLGGQDVEADARSEVSQGGDTLLSDFTDGKFFEIDKFELGLELNDFENAGAGGLGASSDAAVASGKFASWRDARKKTADLKAIQFPVEMQAFSFTRAIDRASPLVFQNCANSIGFASAALVKRKPTGQTAALQGFLRLDFKEVLITSISWSGGELQKETCKFICRALTVQYRQQSDEGALSASDPAQWAQKMALRGQTG